MAQSIPITFTDASKLREFIECLESYYKLKGLTITFEVPDNITAESLLKFSLMHNENADHNRLNKNIVTFPNLKKACMENNYDLVKSILETNPEEHADENGKTPIFYASDIKICELLLEHKHNINHVNNRGSTCFIEEMTKYNINENKIKFLIDNNCTFDLGLDELVLCDILETALKREANGNRLIIDRIVNENPKCLADVCIQEISPDTKYKIVKQLLEAKVDPNIMGKTGTAFSNECAIREEYQSNATKKLLLNYGADFNIIETNFYGYEDTALDWLVETNPKSSYVRYLVSNHAKYIRKETGDKIIKLLVETLDERKKFNEIGIEILGRDSASVAEEYI